MRPYHRFSIVECYENLVQIPLDKFAVESPHPYEKLGAPYGSHSPYFLRQGVVERLVQAQNYLCELCPNWFIQIFDAYRPVAVQNFMVNYAFGEAIAKRGLDGVELSEVQTQEIWQEVHKIWAEPSLNEKTPPPHSTGAAVDVTLVDHRGSILKMGSPIDEMSDRSLPDYYLQNDDPQASVYQNNRQLLYDVMKQAGFCRNPREWWHFSYGDQMWAWLNSEGNGGNQLVAKYGRYS
ncbi:MAG: M15 family metallopeptidase [Cyanobacteria bacterium P01_A01_bin.45]